MSQPVNLFVARNDAEYILEPVARLLPKNKKTQAALKSGHGVR